MADKYRLYGSYLNNPDAGSGSTPDNQTGSLYSQRPWWASDRFFIEVANSANFPELSASAEVSEAISTGSSFYSSDGQLQTYHSVRGWTKKGTALSIANKKRPYVGRGLSGSKSDGVNTGAHTQYAGNHIIRKISSPNREVIWSTVAKKWEEYRDAGQITGITAASANPKKIGGFAEDTGSGGTGYPAAPPPPIS